MENAPQDQPLLLRREDEEEISAQLLTQRGSSFGSSLIADGDIQPINKLHDFFREFSVESKKLWFLAGPAIFTSICQYSLGAISQVFAGQVGTLELAAVSVENSVIAGFSFGVMLGMGSALETLCGQAFGAGQLDMLGVYMQRSWIILDVTALLLTLLYIFAAPLLHLIGQDEKIAEAAGKFAIWMIPQLFAYAMNFPIAKFLQSQSKMMVMAIISCVALVLHTFFSWLLMIKLGWGLVGAAVVLNSSWWFIVIAQLLYIFSGTCGRAWSGFSMKAFENLWGFVRLSIASAVMLCLEVWYFMALILFAGYSMVEVRNLKEIMTMYCNATGQKVNYEKSRIFFSKHIHHKHKKLIKHSLKVGEIGNKDKYLGCPILFTKSKVQDFQYLLEQIRSKLEGWKASVLSQAGREVVIKAVAQSVPVYAMSAFSIPKSLCHKMDSICCQFWWKGTDNSKAARLMSWDKLCSQKTDGGMAFRKFYDFNLALLSKLLWKLHTDKESLWGKIMRPKYLRMLDLLVTPKNTDGSSIIAKGLRKVVDLVKSGALWSIGNGKKVNFWKDAWLVLNGEPVVIADLMENVSSITTSKVADFLRGDGSWDTVKLLNFPLPLKNDILQIPTRRNVQDKLIWRFSKDGRFNVKSAYWALQKKGRDGASSSGSVTSEMLAKLWNGEYLPHIKIFLWKCLVDALPTSDKLRRNHYNVDQNCCLCLQHSETMEHVLFLCPWSNKVWFGSALNLRLHEHNIQNGGWFRLFVSLDGQSGEFSRQNYCFFLMYSIWSTRNAIRFNGEKVSVERTLRSAEQELNLWLKALEEKDQHSVIRRREEEAVVEWIAPPPGWLKINVDAAFNYKEKKGVIAAIVRNCYGEIIKGATKSMQAESSEMAELLAVELGLNLAIVNNYQDICVEGDNLSVIEGITKQHSPSWSSRAIFEMILDMSKWFRSISYRWARRNCNTLAHDLAGKARRSNVIGLVYYDANVLNDLLCNST